MIAGMGVRYASLGNSIQFWAWRVNTFILRWHPNNAELFGSWWIMLRFVWYFGCQLAFYDETKRFFTCKTFVIGDK
jgi:hypothetical protein